MKTGIVYDPIYLEHRIGTHVESHERLVAIMNFLNQKKLFDSSDFKLISPKKATIEQIKYAHKQSLIDEVKEVSELAKITGNIQHLDMDTSVSAKTFEASLYSVGGNLIGIDE
ncbi:MAG: histone deacetylase, partial [Candidatus Thorarchaeota archaeon]